jgi:hypothetical protein
MEWLRSSHTFPDWFHPAERSCLRGRDFSTPGGLNRCGAMTFLEGLHFISSFLSSFTDSCVDVVDVTILSATIPLNMLIG